MRVLHRLLLVLGLGLLSSPLFGDQRASGYCMQGNQVVTINPGLTSTNRVMGSFPRCTVEVFNTGTLVHPAGGLFSDNGMTPLGNPFTADVNGYWFFYVANGRYDIKLSGGNNGGLPSPFTLGDVLVNDPTQGAITLPVSVSQGGTGSANVITAKQTLTIPLINAADYNFAPIAPGGSLTGGIANTVTLTSGPPLGMSGSDVAHTVHISGGAGAAEDPTITGGTCTLGQTTSCTIIFTPANNHSGAWTIQSSTAGLGEAAIAGVGCPTLPNGTITITATLTLVASSAQSQCLSGTNIPVLGTDANSATIVYNPTGTPGPAIQIVTTGTQTRGPALRRLNIKAAGTAVASATAIGISCVACNYAAIEDVLVQGFTGGIAELFTASAAAFGASNQVIRPQLWNNLIGIKFDGVDATHADYASQVTGGFVIGTTAVGSRCFLVTQWPQDTQFSGFDCESVEYGADLLTGTAGNRFLGGRFEFIGQKSVRIGASVSNTVLLGNRYPGSLVSNQVSDSGVLTVRLEGLSNVILNDSGISLNLPDIPVNGEETGGQGRQILNFHSAGGGNYATQLGTSNYGATFLGNFLLGDTIASGYLEPNEVTFANLGTPSRGSTHGDVVHCSNCNTPSPEGATCATGGDNAGALAIRLRGAWKCF